MNQIWFLAAILQGQLTTARNRIEDGPLSDTEGGGLREFQRELEHVGGGGPPFWGLCWRMDRTGLLVPSRELFIQDVVVGGNMEAQHNSGPAGGPAASPSVQIITGVVGDQPGDDYPESMLPAVAFADFLLRPDLTPWGLVFVEP